MTARYLVIMSTTSCHSGPKYDPAGALKHFTIRLYLQLQYIETVAGQEAQQVQGKYSRAIKWENGSNFINALKFKSFRCEALNNCESLPGYFEDSQHQPGQVHQQEHQHSGHNNPCQVNIFPLDQRVSRTGHPSQQKILYTLQADINITYLCNILELRTVRRKAGAIPVVVMGWNNWNRSRNLE